MEDLSKYQESFMRFQEMMGNPYRDTSPKKEPSPEFIEYCKKLKEDNSIQLSYEQIGQRIYTLLHRNAKGGVFRPSEKQKNLLNHFWKHFKNDEEKGILLYGSFGSGKTEMLKAFALTPFNKFNPFEKQCRIISAIEMIDHYNGESNFEKFLDKNLYIDDLGSEQRAKFMSKDDDPILSKFFELWYMRRNHKLYITSNLSKDELHDKYGGRVYSRLHELCTFIEFNDKDYRL